MYTTPELANVIQRDRDRQIAESRRARLATCAAGCCGVSGNLIDRLVRLVRPAPIAC